MERIGRKSRHPHALDPLRTGMSQLVVAHAYGLRLDEVRAPSRSSEKASLARQVAMYLAHVVFSMSLSAVARGFGRKHTTVRHAIIRVEALREAPELDRAVGFMESTLRGMTERT